MDYWADYGKWFPQFNRVNRTASGGFITFSVADHFTWQFQKDFCWQTFRFIPIILSQKWTVRRQTVTFNCTVSEKCPARLDPLRINRFVRPLWGGNGHSVVLLVGALNLIVRMRKN